MSARSLARELRVLGALVGFATGLALGPARIGPAAESQPEWLTLPLGVQQSDEFDAIRLSDARRGELDRAGVGFVDLLRRSEIRVRDGELTRRLTVVRHFVSSRGAQDGGTLHASVRSSNESLRIDAAYVRKRDGSRRTVSPEAIRVIGSSATNLYSDSQRVEVPYPGLEAGATVVFVATVTQRTRDWPLPWSVRIPVAAHHAIERFEAIARWSSGTRAPELASEDPELRCEWDASEVRCRRDAIEARPVEPAAGATDPVPNWILLEPTTWSELAGRVAASMRFEPAAAVSEAARRVVAGAATPTERLLRIRQFVADEVRYVGFHEGSAAIVPHPPSDTLRDRYGDCKDKVALFLAMAQSVDLNAFPVLVSSSRYDVDALRAPTWRYFDHMVACAEIEGDRHCVDLTVPASSGPALPPRLSGAASLDLREGVDSPEALRASGFVWDIELASANQISCSGVVRETLTRSFGAGGEIELRARMRGQTPESRQRLLVADFQALVGSDIEPEIQLSGLDTAQDPIVFASEAEFVASGELRAGMEYEELDVWLSKYAIGFKAGSARRAHPVPGIRIRSRSTFTLCDDFAPALLGPELDFESRYGSLARRYGVGADGVEVETVLTLPQALIPAAETAAFDRFLDRVLANGTIWFSIGRPR